MRTAIQTAALAALVLTAAAAPTLRATPRIALAHWTLDHPFNFTDLVDKTDPEDFPPGVFIDCERHFPNCGSPRFHVINKFFQAHNVSSAHRDAAMQTEDPRVPTELSDAQVNAIVAADEASSDQDTGEDDGVPYDFEQDVRHIKHIYRTLNASFSLTEIHQLFHNKDGLPIMLSDGEVDAAITAHAATTARAVKRDEGYSETHFPIDESPRYYKIETEFAAYNLTSAQWTAAIINEDDIYSIKNPTDAQVDAIISAEQAPFSQEADQEDGVTHDLKKEKQQLAQIYKVLDAKLSPTEIYHLFHSKDGLPIMLSDEEVDAAIVAHSASPVPQVARA